MKVISITSPASDNEILKQYFLKDVLNNYDCLQLINEMEGTSPATISKLNCLRNEQELFGPIRIGNRIHINYAVGANNFNSKFIEFSWYTFEIIEPVIKNYKGERRASNVV